MDNDNELVVKKRIKPITLLAAIITLAVHIMVEYGQAKMGIKIPEIDFLQNINKTVLLVIIIITWLGITIICGKRHNELSGDKMTVGSALKYINKDKVSKKNNKMLEFIIEATNFALTMYPLIIWGLILNRTFCIILFLISLMFTIIFEILKKFKMVDVCYSLIFISMINTIIY